VVARSGIVRSRTKATELFNVKLLLARSSIDTVTSKALKGRYSILESASHLGFEGFAAVTMKNAVFWDVAPCGFIINRRFGDTASVI
jgi:hypothetical protein